MTESVTEFVILAPDGAHQALVYSRERLRSFLAAAFPRFSFSLAEMAGEGPEDEFVVVPVVGRIDDEDHLDRMLSTSDETLAEIRAALEGFQFNAGMLH